MRHPRLRSLRMVVDAAVLATAFLLAVLLRFEFHAPTGIIDHLVWWLPVVVVVGLLALTVSGGHRHPWRFTDLSALLLLGEAMAAAMLLLLSLWYASPHLPLLRDPANFHRLSRTVIVLQTTFGFLGLCGVRLVRRWRYEHHRRRSRERRGLRRRRVVLLGAGRTGRTVAHELVQHPELMLQPVGFVDNRPDLQDQLVGGLPVLGTVEDLAEVSDCFRVDSALLTWDDPTGDSRRCVRERAEEILPVRTVPALVNLLGGRAHDENGHTKDDPDGLWAGPVEPEPPQIPAAKQAVDVVVGSLLAVVATPVIVVLATAAAWQLRAWPFFIQDRLGLGQRRFRFPKIRTMPPGTPEYELLPDERQLPAFCQWLRRHHLDELPQLYLVPFGSMSLVGPRPKMPDDVEPTNKHYRTMRTLVPQGCTCLWQIGVHTDDLPSDSPEYDFWYLTHGSVRMDIWIMWQTLRQILGQEGGRPLHAVPDFTKGSGWIDTDLVFDASESSSSRREPLPAVPAEK